MNDNALQEIIDRITALFTAQSEEAERLREQLDKVLVCVGVVERIPRGWHLVHDLDGGWYLAPLTKGGNFVNVGTTAHMALQSLEERA